MRKIIFVAAAASVVAAAGGFAAGYKLAVRRLNDVYNEQMEEELNKTRAYYERNQRTFPDPVAAAKALVPEEVAEIKAEAARVAVETPEGEVSTKTLERVLEGLKYNKITPSPEILAKHNVTVVEKVETSQNIFKNQGDVLAPEEDPEYDEMMENRNHQAIYIVSQEEHLENPHELEVVQLTYFIGDNVLAEENKLVDDPEAAIGGVENLQFGRWSKDPSFVYIRNEHLGIEYEIARSTGKYSVEVLGLDAD